MAPFYMEQLYKDLNSVTGLESQESIHLTDFPVVKEEALEVALEEKMALAPKMRAHWYSLRKKHKIKVRQPLGQSLGAHIE